MRIISKYKDYYDSAISMGIDMSIVYDRKLQSKVISKPSGYDSTIKDLDFASYGSIIFDNKDNLWNPQSRYSNEIYLIGFCGKLYIAYNFLYIHNEEISESKTFFKPNSVLEYFEKLRSKHKDEHPVCFTGYSNRTTPTDKEIHKTFEQNVFKRNYDDWFHHFGTPVFSIFLYAHREHKSSFVALRNEECYVTLNPSLKEFEFFKLKDPFTCFQEIQQYMSGVLSNTEINEFKLNDKHKIQSHGFDMKYGFRTRPNKK